MGAADAIARRRMGSKPTTRGLITVIVVAVLAACQGAGPPGAASPTRSTASATPSVAVDTRPTARSDATARPTPTIDPTLLDFLTGPWRPEPMALALGINPGTDAVVRINAAAEAECRHDGSFPQDSNARLVLVDARGMGRLMALFEGPLSTARCDYLVIGKSGVSGTLGSWGPAPSPRVVAPDRLADVSVNWSGGPGGLEWQKVDGRAGDAIERVIVDTEIGPVTATVRDGWFSAWWPAKPTFPVDEQPRGYTVTAFGADDRILDRFEWEP